MDGAASAPDQQDGAPKKSAYDSLDKSELITKCKGLLQLAKSAKQTKDEYAAENIRLKETVAALHQQRTDDKENLKILQASLRKLNDTVATLEEQKVLDKDYMKGMHEMVDELTNEKDTLARRCSRLTADNDSLLSDCRQSDTILKQLHESMAAHQQQVQQLQLMCEQQKTVNTDLRQLHAGESQRAQRLEGQLTAMHERCQSHEAKLRLYRTKLVGVAGQLKQMRVCKEVLLTTVTEYSQAVCKWQADIVQASADFLRRNSLLSESNRALEAKYEALLQQQQQQHAEPSSSGDGNQGDDAFALRAEIDRCNARIAELNEQLAAARAGDPEAVQNYKSTMLSLDDTLQTIASESVRLQAVHDNERTLLQTKCAALEQQLAIQQSQQDCGREAEHRQQIATLTDRLQQQNEQNRRDNATLVLERDTLIEKGQHLIEMVEELQQNLQRTGDELHAQHNGRQSLVAEHAASVAALQATADGLQSQLSESQAECERINRDVSQLTQQALNSGADSDELRSQLTQSREDCERLSSALETRTEDANALALQLEQSHAECQRCRSEITELTEQTQHFAAAQADLELMRSQLAQSESECQRLSAETEESRSKLTQSLLDIEGLNSEIVVLTARAQDGDSAAQTNLDELRAQLKKSACECDRLNAKVAELTNQTAVSNEEWQFKLSQLQTESERLNEDLLKKSDDITALQTSAEELREQLVQSQTDGQRLQAEARADVERLNGEVTELKEQAQQSAAEQEKRDELRLQLTQSQFEAQANVERLNTELTQSLSDVERLNRQVTELTEQIQQSAAGRTNVEELRVQLTQSQSELQAELANHSQNSAKAQGEIERLSTELDQSKSNLEELRAQLTHSQSVCERLTAELNVLTEQSQANDVEQNNVKDLRAQLTESQTNCERLNTELAEMTKQSHIITALRANIEELQSQLTLSQQTGERLNTEIAELTAQSVSVQMQHKQELATAEALLSPLGIELNELKEQLKTSEATVVAANTTLTSTTAELNVLTKQLDACTVKRDEALRTAAADLVQHEQTVLALTTRLNETQATLASLQQQSDLARAESDHQLASKTREMDDLLSEMRELNEALRNRGDVISKQEQRIVALGAELTERGGALERALDERAGLLERLQEAEAARTAATAAATCADISYDQLSTSTVSRVEEVARMRDLEDSFEEKYNKLRQLAVKLKRKCSEQAQRLEELEGGANSGGQVTQSRATNVTAEPAKADGAQQARNLQLMQKENDKLLDELDRVQSERKELSAKTEQLAGDLTAVRAELSAAQLVIGELKGAASAGSTQKSQLDQAVKEYVKQIQSLKEELVGVRQQRQTADEELTTVKEQLKKRNDDLTEQAAELKKLKSSLKKTNVLSLEIEAQEKSLIDIAHKLDAKSAQVEELQTTLKQQDESVASLKQQIRSMEEELRAEQEHSAELKAQLNVQHAKFKESESSRADLQQRLDEMQSTQARTDEELLDLRTASAQSSGDLEKCLAVLRTENQQLQQRLIVSEEQAGDGQAKLRATGQELDALRTEFVAYKVRAQSMLRQNQQQETSRECELEEELATARATHQLTVTKLTTAQQHVKQLEATVAELRTECDRLQAHAKQLMLIADEARTNADALQADLLRQTQEHQEALRAQRLQSETLSVCYKKEIAELRATHEQQLQQLQLASSSSTAVAGSDANAVRTTPSNPAVSGGDDHHHQHRSAVRRSDEQRIEWILSERQAAEGSESTTSAQRRLSTTTTASNNGRGHRGLMPLDELLNSSFDAVGGDDGGGVDDNDDDGGDRRSPDLADVQQTRQRLHVQESRVKHLTTLLAESEQDTARLTQLNDALKEELRRQERSAEREQHLHNLEYLKNVMFKFLTINQGDEKAHLVPVLNTMLKLSPDETQKLQAVAKGTDASQRGWGRYLPI